MGEYPPSEASVNSVKSVEGLAQTNLEWVLWKEFGGWRGYGRDAIPSYENSHGLHGCAQIRRQKRSLKICEHLCNLWEALICQKVLWVLRIPWENILRQKFL